jgi:hypothetical protein
VQVLESLAPLVAGDEKGLCYTVKMKENDPWSNWSEKIHELKLTGITLTLLEGAGPFRFILSQGLFAFLPFVSTNTSSSWKAFAQMLENPDDTRSFAGYLREERM